jgi:peptidoglycan/LPS O-acetylase OafA/YrhL
LTSRPRSARVVAFRPSSLNGRRSARRVDVRPLATSAVRKGRDWVSGTKRRPGGSDSSHRNDIQGLRAVAVLLVALNHAGVGFLKGGYVGVDVFFVLSGFLITGLLISGAGKMGFASLGDFYARRARRILPAAALTLVATDIAAYLLLNFVRAKEVLQDSIPASLFVANFHFASQGTDYFAHGQPPSPIQQFWSLAVEEQFYLVWPLTLLLVLLGLAIRRRGRARSGRRAETVTAGGMRRLLAAITGIGVASLVWSVYYTHAHPTSSYFSTLSRAWELALGAALTIGASQVSRLPAGWRAALGWLGVAAIVAAAVAFSSTTPFPGYAALLPTLGAVLVIAAGLGRSHSRLAVRRVLSTPLMRFVGDRSYAFYLWHWPVLIIAMQYEGHSLSVGVNLLLLAGAFGLSIVSYALFENPIRHMRWSSPNTALILWPVSVLTVIIVAGWGIGQVNAKATRLADVGVVQYPGYVADSVTTGLPAASASTSTQAYLQPASGGGALPAVVAAVQAAARKAPIPTPLSPALSALLNDYWNVPSGCTPGVDQSSGNICSFGSNTATRTLVVVGDSHAQMWMPAILYTAANERLVVRTVWKEGCSPDQWWKVVSESAACRAWYAWAISQVRALHPSITLVAINWNGLDGSSAATTAGMSALVASLKKGSGKVVVIGDDTPQSHQPIDCLLAAHANLGSCSSSPSSADLATGQTISSAATAAGAAYIDTRGWFCFNNVCPMVIDRTIAPRDNAGHITVTYAAELGQVFRLAFRKAIGLPPPVERAAQPASQPQAALPLVVAAARAAQRGAPIPSGLTPSISSLLSDRYNYPSGCGAENGQSSVSVCSLGDTSASRPLVVMGDSHAQTWMPAILAMAQKDGWVVRPIGKSACIPLEWWHLTKATPDCRAWYRWAIGQIKALHPSVTLLAAAFAGVAGEAATSGMSSLVRSLRAYSQHVVVLADQPPQKQQPVDCLLASDANMARCSLTPSPAQLDIGDALKSAAESAGASYVDTSGWFCFQDVCPMVVGTPSSTLTQGT